MQLTMNGITKEEETCVLLEIANAEVANLRQQLTEHEETIEQLTDENADLRAELAQLKLEMEAIGAGGVSLMGSRP